ncbi:MAG: cytochrome c maturation protein CcmE [Gammaproteobacteria bacterium]|nr:cytochrome c maturation protein CcmE [Gammaproteobacteria bacterium]NBR18131.1 cytochrome c maturation protein CcmE [Gammaproteobacteria bacterium]NCW58083.1 cytochrome c maturation protein CcmE [Gammaproteobacteria bacterium]NDA44188.1 cytochrome c maturation protein CcmE [Gammaproteobacteria bacterium]NDB25787.1 cytochrome c maturation protein CcmE [Gammaproteobacteria bacterium]
MTPRQRRITLVVGILAGVSLAGVLALNAFRDNVMFFFDPSQVAAGEAPIEKRFRLGGMVRPGTVDRRAGSLDMSFVVTDFKQDVKVVYSGVVPDLFRENQGVVAHGRLGRDGIFVADEILAKHDENYMPPEVARAIKEKHGGVMPVNPDHAGPPKT